LGDKVIREKKKIVKQKPKAKTALPLNLQHMLSQRIEDQKILKELESRPFDFGETENKVIKIADKTRNKK